MPTCWMLVGVPYSGKTTWGREAVYPRTANTVLVSTDEFIEEIAGRCGKQYHEMFEELYPLAEMVMMHDIRQAILRNKNIIWDQTNLSAKSRAKKLATLPETYEKIAVWFPIPNSDQINERIAKRSNKIVSIDVVSSLKNHYQRPSIEEGFDRIESSETFSLRFN